MTFTTPDGTQLATLEEALQYFINLRCKIFTTYLSEHRCWVPLTPDAEPGIFIYIAEELTETERNSFMKKLNNDAENNIYSINHGIKSNLHAGDLLYYATVEDSDCEDGYDLIKKEWLDLLQHLPVAYDGQYVSKFFVISDVTKDKLYSFSAVKSHFYTCEKLADKVLTLTENGTWRRLDFNQYPSRLLIIGRLTNGEEVTLIKWLQSIQADDNLSTFDFDPGYQIVAINNGWAVDSPIQ